MKELISPLPVVNAEKSTPNQTRPLMSIFTQPSQESALRNPQLHESFIRRGPKYNKKETATEQGAKPTIQFYFAVFGLAGAAPLPPFKAVLAPVRRAFRSSSVIWKIMVGSSNL